MVVLFKLMILEILKILLILSWILIFPSFLLTQLSGKKTLKQFMIIFSLVLIFLPLIPYYASLVANNFLSLTTIIVLSSLLNLFLLSFIIYKKHKFKRINFSRVGLFVLLIIFGFNFLVFTFPDKLGCQTFWIYRTLKTDYVITEKSDPNNIYNAYYDFEPREDNIIQNYWVTVKEGNDEPFSIGIHQSFFVVLFNFLGFRIFYALIMVCGSAILFYVVNMFTKNSILSFFSVFLFNLFSIMHSLEEGINPNYFAFLIAVLMVYFLTQENMSKKDFIFAGILYGLLGSVRPITLLFVIGLVGYFYYQKFKGFILFGVSALIIVAPVLMINQILYNNPLQFPGFLYYPVSFEHNFLGIHFHIRTLLNFPFYERIVRTPSFPYPVFIYLPLVLLKNFGLILFSLIFFGPNGIKDKGRKWLFSVTPFIFILFLSINENWREAKTTLLILVFPFLIMLSINGLKDIIVHFKKKKMILIYLALIIIIIFCVKLSKNLDFPKDERQLLLPRTQFYHENKQYIQDQREELTRIDLLPQLYIRKINLNDTLSDIKSKQVLPPLSRLDQNLAKNLIR